MITITSKLENPIYFFSKVSKSYRLIFIAVWLTLFFAVWCLNPVQGMPYPSEVFTAFGRLWNLDNNYNLLYNTWVTLKLNVMGLFFASIISLIISYFWTIPALRPFNQIMQWVRYLPVVAFNLVFLSFFTIGWSMKVAMMTVGMSLFLINSMTKVIGEIPTMKYELAQVLNYSRLKIFWTVVARPTFPSMIDMIAQNAAFGWIMIVAIETFNRTEGGIGAQIYGYSSTNQLPEVYVYLIVIGVIAVIEDLFFVALKRLLFPYTAIAERG